MRAEPAELLACGFSRGVRVDFEDVIEAFRQKELDVDCQNMELKQRGGGRVVYRGKGYIKQNNAGGLVYKVYVDSHENAWPFRQSGMEDAMRPGKIFAEDMYYDLVVTATDGTTWTSERLYPSLHWNMTDQSVIVDGEIDTIRADLAAPQRRHHQRLHFFEELDVPLHKMTKTECNGRTHYIRDSAVFSGVNSDFEVRKREGSGDTVVNVFSNVALPEAFHLRIQEALQYITGKSTNWRARVKGSPEGSILELRSLQGESHRSRFSQPIHAGSIEYLQCGWNLFVVYLGYVVNNTVGHVWNPVAYHLYIAREASTSTIDSAAVGVSVALEAIASMVSVPADKKEAARLICLQKRLRDYMATLTEFSDFAERVKGLLGMLKNKRPQDVLHYLAGDGAIEMEYIKSWSNLRNRQVHPKLSDLKPFDLNAVQAVLDDIRKTEVLLHQVVFHLIGYTGPFTDYGLDGYPIRTYPLLPKQIEAQATSQPDGTGQQ